MFRIKLACLAEDYDRAMTEATKNLECLNSLGDAESIVDMVHRAVSSRRGAIRILCPSITNEVGTNYREELIEDLLRLISNAMDVINKVTEGPKHDVQIEIHMMKLKADLHRYRSEFTQDDCSLPIYEKAATLAEKHLSHTHPLRIKLALTHAVALFNVGKEREARSILTKASDALSINNNNTTGDDQEIKIFTNIIKQKLAISQH